jgi:regulation of enolase protein 1 (concanavalin A-like superfamily)
LPSKAAAQLKPGRDDFRCGEKVSFEDKYLQTQVGIVVRINQRTATVDTGDGHSWRVGFPLLRHVLDI